MTRSPLQPLRYNKQVTFWISEEIYIRLCKIASDKGYGSNWKEIPGVVLKRPKTGAARLVREIVESYILNLPKSKT